VISTTAEHPFWTADKGWVEAKDLIVGSLLQTADGRVVDVDKIEKREGPFEVYNFKVEGIPTYFVSELGVLVHNAGDTYSRPKGFRKNVREDVWERAKAPDGNVDDPLTGRQIDFDEPWDMGHKPGYEFRKHRESARRRGIDRKQFLEEHNNPEHYRPELPSSNQSHAGEDMSDTYLGA